MNIDTNDYKDLVEKDLFWSVFIINLEITMRENRYSIDTLPIESAVNYPNINKAVDAYMEDNYINVIKDTSLLSYILQFVIARNPKGSRREILCAVRDVVIDTIKEHVSDKYDIICDNCDTDNSTTHTDYTTESVINLMYKRVLAKLELTKETEFTPKLKECISIYILHVATQLISYIDQVIFEQLVQIVRDTK